MEREERPDPPPVTIVDPLTPARDGDVLAGGREPWHPSARQVVVLVGVLALLAAATVAVLAERRDRALDEAARRDVALAVSVREELADTSAAIPVQLVNLGTRPVRVLAVALPESTPAELRGATLETGGTVDVVVPDTRPCPSDPVRVEPTTFLVRVETGRGDRVTREVAVAPARDAIVKGFETTRCGLLTPAAAVSASNARARTAGGVMAITFPLVNASRFEVVLDGFEAPAGLAMEGPERVVLPAPAGTTERAVGIAQPVRVLLRLRVTDCGALAGSLGTFMDWPAVAARATSELSQDPLQLPLTDFGVGSAFDALTAGCPGVPRYAGPSPVR